MEYWSLPQYSSHMLVILFLIEIKKKKNEEETFTSVGSKNSTNVLPFYGSTLVHGYVYC